MKAISIFNNKGGVGKTTLTFHLAQALCDMGKKVLMIDLDPQCNLTIISLPTERIHKIWEEEDEFLEDFGRAHKNVGPQKYKKLISSPRSIHFHLKPTEDGVSDIDTDAPAISLRPGLDLIPGRLTLHTYEEKVASRWPQALAQDPLAVRTLSKIRQLANSYGEKYKYDYVILDTSPSLGTLNKLVISTADGFFIPCMPDMFSLYGIKNIGQSLKKWKKDFDILYSLLDGKNREQFPSDFVSLYGYTIYNAKKYSGSRNVWNLATAHFNYAKQIPDSIGKFIPDEVVRSDLISHPIGGVSIMHTHNTLPNMAQKYHQPMWMIPSYQGLDTDDVSTIFGNRGVYEATKSKYIAFADDLISRIPEE